MQDGGLYRLQNEIWFRIGARKEASMANKSVDHEHSDTNQRIKKLEEQVKQLEQQIRDLQHKMQTHDHPHTH